MENKITVSQLKFELNKVLEKLNQFDDGEKVTCWHTWPDEMLEYNHSDRFNFINAIQIYRDTDDSLQLEVNCFE